MKAVTICQPYAELIARGDKRIENRTWATAYRGPLAIHAGRSRAWLDGDEDREYGIDVDAIPFGAVVAVAELIDCRLVHDLPRAWADHRHANGPWCWMLAHVRRINPIPYRGAQKIWDLPDEALR